MSTAADRDLDRGDASTELLGDVISLPDGTVVWDTLTALGPQPQVEDEGTATGERYDPAWGYSAGSWAANVFCPTGEGGGVDPSCSPGKAGGAAGWADLTKTSATPEDVKALNAHARQTLRKAKGTVAFPAELVKEYTGAAYRSLNEEMRRCPPEFHCVTEPNSLLLHHLRTLLDGAAPLPKPVDVYRGLNARQATRDALLDEYSKRAGTDGVVQMPSFTSTSLDADTAGAFSVGTNRLMFKITAKTGLYVDKISEMPGERELLQSPSTRYRVKAVHQVEGKPPLVHLEEL